MAWQPKVAAKPLTKASGARLPMSSLLLARRRPVEVGPKVEGRAYLCRHFY